MDLIIVVGTEKEPSFSPGKIFRRRRKVQFIERTSSPDFQKKLLVEEKPLLFFFYSSRCPTCRHLKVK